MSDIQYGTRVMIFNLDGKVVGTAMPSKKFFGKTVVGMICPFTRNINSSMKSPEECEAMMEKNPTWTFGPSFYTAKCEMDGDDVVIELTHNALPEWNSKFTVPFQVNWKEDFKNSLNESMKKIGRETHIGNYSSMSV